MADTDTRIILLFQPFQGIRNQLYLQQKITSLQKVLNWYRCILYKTAVLEYIDYSR